MGTGENHDSDIAAKLVNESIIKAADDHRQPSILPLSNFDLLMGGFPVTIFYAYRNPSAGDFDSIVTAIKTSLSETLTHFYPFAGRIVHNSVTGEAEILCNNAGIKFMEARATVPLAILDFHDQSRSMRKVLLPFLPEHPLSVQVTGYTCGGFSVAWCFDHLLADATSFIKFLNSWSEIARTKQLSAAISHDRSIFRPRSPPVYGPSVDRTYTVCTMDDILSMPPNGISQKRSYYVEGPCLERLREASSRGGSKRTRTEALSAYLWKVMARACGGGNSNARCKMGWMIDGRRRMTARNHDDSMPNYVGNVVSISVGEESAQELKHRTLSHVAGIVSGAIREASNDYGHFLDLIDWIECHRPAMMLPELLLGLGGPALVVSSCHNMPVMAVDFGFGRPSLGMFYSTLDRTGAGYVNLVSSGRDDGGLLVSTFIWPELADALESDPDHVFQPITADHLGW